VSTNVYYDHKDRVSAQDNDHQPIVNLKLQNRLEEQAARQEPAGYDEYTDAIPDPRFDLEW